MANLFLMVEPLTGWTEVKVTERRTKVDWAQLMKELVDEHYPEAEVIVLVLDNWRLASKIAPPRPAISHPILAQYRDNHRGPSP